MNNSQFTDEEIKEQLSSLGFKAIPNDKFQMFKKDLEKLIHNQTTTSNNTSTSVNSSPSKLEEQLREEAHNQVTAKLKKVTFPDDNYDESRLNDEECDASFVSITTTSSIMDNKVIKRKVLRKSKSMTPNDHVKPASRLDNLRDDLNNLKISQANSTTNEFNLAKKGNLTSRSNDEHHREINRSQEIINFDDENHSPVEYVSEDENYLRLNDHYMPVNYPVKSFIRSQSSISLRSDTSRSSVNKSNPLKLFQDYRKVWNKHKTPGEKNHNDLRWSIREQMLEKHVIVKKQQKTFIPNTYVIPTEKKRQQLRWLVRSSLANPI